MKHVKESLMSDEIANQDIENTAKNVKSSEKAIEVVKKMKKTNGSNKYSILCPAYQQIQNLKDLNSMITCKSISYFLMSST